MAAISQRAFTRIRDNFRKLASRYVHALRCEFTPDEIHEALIAPDHLDALRKVVELCGPISDNAYARIFMRTPQLENFEYSNGRMPVGLRYQSSSAIPLPKYVSNNMGATFYNTEFEVRIHQMIAQKLELYRRTSTVLQAISILVDSCSNMKQVAFYMPNVHNLLDPIEDKAAIAVATSKGLPNAFPTNLLKYGNMFKDATQYLNHMKLVDPDSKTYDDVSLNLGFPSIAIRYTGYGYMMPIDTSL